jgi:hypothetical protein
MKKERRSGMPPTLLFDVPLSRNCNSVPGVDSCVNTLMNELSVMEIPLCSEPLTPPKVAGLPNGLPLPNAKQLRVKALFALPTPLPSTNSRKTEKGPAGLPIKGAVSSVMISAISAFATLPEKSKTAANIGILSLICTLVLRQCEGAPLSTLVVY